MSNGYTALKLSWELYQKAPDALDPAERQRLGEAALKLDTLERRILSSREAAAVQVPDATLQNRLTEIRSRYPDDATLHQDLASIGLQAAQLASAVERDLRIEAVLERAAAAAPPVTRVDAELYYHLHPAAFDRPETRRLRHILMTYNNRAERDRHVALLNALRPTLSDCTLFGEVALRHSHCPTALEGGQLGVIRRGQLFPELEPAAFSLAEGALSEVLTSPVGLHLIYCEAILPSGPLPFDEVADRIVARLEEQRRSQTQRRWIATLPTPTLS